MRSQLHIGRKAIAAPRHRRDDAVAVRSQRLTQREHRLFYVGFLDNAARPRRIEQFVFGDDPAGIADQMDQHLEDRRRQRQWRGVAAQPPAAHVQPEGTEGVDILVLFQTASADVFNDSRRLGASHRPP